MILAGLRRQAPLAALACVATAGCDAIWGVHKATLYVADAGTTAATGGAGGSGGATGGGGTSTGGSGGCAPGTTIPCYDGPQGTEGVGICVAGSRTCKPDGTGYGDCTGAVLPQMETCAATLDEDCSGFDCVKWALLVGEATAQVAPAAVARDTDGNIIVAGSFTGEFTVGGSTLTAKTRPRFSCVSTRWATSSGARASRVLLGSPRRGRSLRTRPEISSWVGSLSVDFG